MEFLRQQRRFFLFVIFLFAHISLFGQITLILESLPNNTPDDDSLFVCGSFNNWNVHDTRYLLKPQSNGKYMVSLLVDSAKVEYKFSRGSWMKTETDSKNEYLPNRVYTRGEPLVQKVTIQNWQDLGGSKGVNYFALLLFSASLYSLLLFYLAFRIQKRSINKIKRFVLFNSAMVVVLIGGLTYTQTDLIWRSHIATLGYIIVFLWSPILSHFIGSFKVMSIMRYWRICYVFVLLFAFLAISQWLNIVQFKFLSTEFNHSLTWGKFLQLSVGLFCVVLVHIQIVHSEWKQLFSVSSTDIETRFVSIVLLISISSVFLFAIRFFVLVFDISSRLFSGFEPVLAVFCVIILVELFYYWKYPELMREKITPSPIIHLQLIKEKLDDFMRQNKPYTNPDLSLSDLSELLDIKLHILSKVINEHYNKNFRDYINEYRVKEFVKLSKQENHKNLTFLAIALEVGFNSKSTFNLAFKKVTNQSPRDYLKDLPESVTVTQEV